MTKNANDINSFSSLKKSDLFSRYLLDTDNKKLISNDRVQFLRLNIPAVITCPHACESCKKLCYALKAERVYPNVKRQREASLAFTMSDSFVESMVYTINAHLSRPKFQNKKVVIRIHESGDFYSVEYLAKWLDIIKHFKGNENIVFCAYTKSIPFLKKLGLNSTKAIEKKYPNLVLSASLWADMDSKTKRSMRDYKTYTALSAEDIEKEKANGKQFHICRCADCGPCMACMTNKVKKTVCEIH